jgi:hypothetical protein
MRFRRRSITHLKILHLLLFPVVRIICALRIESRKNYQRGLIAGLLEFKFLRPRGCLTNPFRTLALCFGVVGKTPYIIYNNFVKEIVACIGHRDNAWQDVTRSSLRPGVTECAIKRVLNFLFTKPSFRIRRATVLGMFKDLLSFWMPFDGLFN